MDLNKILASMTQGTQQMMGVNDAAAQRYQADTAQIQNLLTLNEQEAAAAVQTASQVAGQEAQLQYRVDKAKQANAALAGMNPDDLNNAYVRSLAAFDEAEAERQVLAAQREKQMGQIQQLQSISLLDNPLGFLAAQLQLPQVAQRHNATLAAEEQAAGRGAAAQAEISARVGMINAKNSIIAANTADEMLALNTKKAELANARAQMELRAAKADNISKIGARALDMVRFSQENFKLQQGLLDKAVSLEGVRLQRENNAIQRAAAAEAARARAEEKNAKVEEVAALNSRLAMASNALGYETPFTLTTLKLLPKDKQEALLKTALDGKFGGSLPEALGTVQAIGSPATISVTNPGMGKFIANSQAALRNFIDQERRQATAKGEKRKEAQLVQDGTDAYEAAIVNSAMSFESKQALNSKNWDQVFNPYKPEYLALADAADGGSLPQLKGNAVVPVIKNLRTQLAPGATNIRGEDMELLVKTVAQQVADGKLGADKAALDLVNFHRIAANKNVELYNYTQFGLPQQTSAIVTIPPVTFSGKPFKLDLMNPGSTKAELARMAREQKLGSIGVGIESAGIPSPAQIFPFLR